MATAAFTMLGALGAAPAPTSGTLLSASPVPYTIYYDGELNPGETFTFSYDGAPESEGASATYIGTDDNGTVYFTAGTYEYGFTNAPITTGDSYEIQAIDFLCFVAGTLIQTERGEVPVETLRAGDVVLARRGAHTRLEPLLWVGRSQARVTSGLVARKAAPIHIVAGALGPNMPVRDLRVSPEHALLVDGVLVPAGLLVNGSTITQPLHRQDITYYHLELETHGLLLSDGTWTESYRDSGNRHLFNNASILSIAGEFDGADTRGRTDTSACLPIIRGGSALERLQLMIARRAGVLGQPTTAASGVRQPEHAAGLALPVQRAA